jgi:tight adherence protein C
MQTIVQILTILLSGAAVASIGFVLTERVANSNALRKRLPRIVRQNRASADTSTPRTPGNQKVDTVINILSRLSLPEEGWQSSGIRIRFLQAGIRNKKAPQYYFAIKTMLTLVLPAVLALFLHFTQPHIPLIKLLMLVLLTAAAGYYLPELVLRIITQQRIERMRNGLPDMIDLMVICTESGMSINAAIARISREMARPNPDLAQEFYLSALEMRAGATRIEALRNLALRTCLEDLKDLVSVLAQAEKFGTGLAESLRVQSDMMRTRRTQRAEELAAKIPVKMTLPLVLFIFPTLLLVLLGPAVLQIMKAFSK